MPQTPTDDALPTTPALALRLLGAAAWRGTHEAAGGGRSGWQLLPRKDAALLARLALEGRQPRTRIAQWLWHDVALPRAHANLRQRLYKLRQQAGALVDEADDGLQIAPVVGCDLWRDGCADDAAFESDLLAGLPAADDPLQHWLDDARRQWQSRRADAMTALVVRHEARAELAAAIALVERLLALEPMLEHAWRRLMRLHARRGDRAAAIAAFERCEQVLRDELGVRPSPETQVLLHELQSGASPVVVPGATSSVLPPALLRPPRMLGRDAVLRELDAAWQAGRAFLLVGDAGLGKSRLLSEWAAAGPGRVVAGARPGDEAVPYAALVRLLRAMARTADRPDALWLPAPAHAHRRQELARLLPELGPAPAAPGLEVLLHDAVEQVFLLAPAAGLSAVLFDDLQHADVASRSVLQRVSQGDGLRWGLASRPTAWLETSAWLGSSARVQPVRLAGLDEVALQGLLQDCTPAPLQAADRAQWAALLAHRCAGNPLFVLETLRHWLMHGAASGSQLDALAPSVEALLLQRVGELSAPARTLLHVAAVAGADFSADVAADVLQATLSELAEAWRELEAAQWLRDGALAHDTLGEAALRSLPQAIRLPLHARVARSLQGRGAPAQRVSAHFAAAGLPGEAAEMAMAAAAQARRVGRTEERVRMLAEAAAGFDAAGRAAEAMDARIEAVSADHVREGPSEALIAHTAALVPQACNRDQRVHLHLLRSALGLSRFDGHLCREAAAAALAEAEPGSDLALSASTLAAAALAYIGQPQQAADQVAGLLPRLRDCADALLATDLWGYGAMAFAQAGRYEDCIQALRAQRRLAGETGKADDEGVALISLVSQYLLAGDLEPALACGHEALALQRRLGAGYGVIGALVNLAQAQAAAWQLAAALNTIEEADATLTGMAVGVEMRSHVDAVRAEIWLRAVRPQRALDVLAVADAPALSAPRRVALTTLRARALALLGRADSAAAAWREVLGFPPEGVIGLRGHLLAAIDGVEAAQAQWPVLQAAVQDQPPAVQGLAAWAGGVLAVGRGDWAAAAATARELRSALPRMRHPAMPEHLLRLWICDTLARGDDAAEASEAWADGRRWWAACVQPGLPEGAEAAWRQDPALRRLVPAA